MIPHPRSRWRTLPGPGTMRYGAPPMNSISSPAAARRPMGRGPATVLPIGFGCMGLVGWYGQRNDEEARATLLAAVEAGIDYATLSALHPGLIYARMTGFGHEGPWAGRPGWRGPGGGPKLASMGLNTVAASMLTLFTGRRQ